MSAGELAFIDNNVWLYAFVAGEPTKSAKAATVLQRSSPVVSVQVINEVCANLIRKAGFQELDVRALIESFYARCLVVSLDEHVLLKASDLRDRYSLSFWDSMIIACALRCSATILYSEDLQNGLLVDGASRIVNPFLPE